MTILAWDNLKEIMELDSESESEDNLLYDQLCQNSKASDFYFSVKKSEDADSSGEEFVDITICPKIVFNQEGYCWDQHMDLDHLLPEDFGNLMEGTWSCNRPAEEVKNQLTSLGFLFSQDFEDFMNSCNPDW